MIAFYEREDAQPPGSMLADLARALKVSADELLGLKTMAEQPTLKAARLLKRLEKITDLSATDQCTVLKLLDALHTARLRVRAKARAS